MNKEVEEMHTKIDKEFINKNSQHKIELYKVVAVGHLDSSEDYEKGEVPLRFIEKLKSLWTTGIVMASLGYHECDFCEGEYGNLGRATSSCEKILFDKENKIKYIFPEMIFHYIEEHKFLPSNEFIKFVMETK